MSTGTYVPVTCAACAKPILDASFIWTGTGMYHNQCRPAGGYVVPPGNTGLTEADVRRIVREELERARGVKGGQGG